MHLKSKVKNLIFGLHEFYKFAWEKDSSQDSNLAMFFFETAVNFEQSCENASSILSHVISSWAQSELPRKRWDMALLKLRCTYFLKVDITWFVRRNVHIFFGRDCERDLKFFLYLLIVRYVSTSLYLDLGSGYFTYSISSNISKWLCVWLFIHLWISKL